MSSDDEILDPNGLPVTPCELRRAMAFLVPAEDVDDVARTICEAFAQQERDRQAAEAAIAAGERDPELVNYGQVGVGLEVLVACSLLGDDIHARILLVGVPERQRPGQSLTLAEAEGLLQSENPEWWTYWSTNRPAIAARLTAGLLWDYDVEDDGPGAH